jgi:hypothetical protein
MPSRTSFLNFWTVLTLVGFLLYLALPVFISREPTWRLGLMAVACVTAALAVLLVVNESSRTSLSSVGAAFLNFWTVLTLVGLLLYLALLVFISREPTRHGVMAVACVTAALAVLLVVEEGSNLTFPLCCLDQIACWCPRDTP